MISSHKTYDADFYRNIIHPLISILLSWLGEATLIAFLDSAIPMISIPVIFYPWLLIVAAGEVLLGNVLFEEHAALSARVREVLVFAVITYAAAVLPRNLPVERLFIPGPMTVILVIATVFQWFWTNSIHNALRAREIFLRSIQDTSGDALKERMRNTMTLIGDTTLRLRGIRSGIFFIQMIIITMLLFFWGANIAISNLMLFLSISYTFVCFLGAGSINIFLEDQTLFGDGIVGDSGDQRRRFLFAGIVTAGAIAVSLLFSRNRSVFPFQAIIDFLNWLFNLFRPEESPAFFAEEILPEMSQESSMIDEILKNTPEGGVFFDFTALFEFIKTISFWVAIAALAFFILRPLFSRSGRRFLMQFRLFDFLRQGFSNFITWMASVLENLKEVFAGRSAERILRDQIRKGTLPENAVMDEKTLSILKRMETNTMIRAFLKLIRAGKRFGIPYTDNLGPLEYLKRLAVLFPDSTSLFYRAAEIFEESLFSRHTISQAHMDEYLSAVKSIIILKREPTPPATSESKEPEKDE